MHPAIRTQTDQMQDFYTELSALDCTDSVDRARQEFKDEADINKLLARFGVHAQQRQPTFGEVDFDLDLQQALFAVQEAKQAHRAMPATLRERYPTWQSLLNGLESGEFKLDLNEERRKAAAAEPAAKPEP